MEGKMERKKELFAVDPFARLMGIELFEVGEGLARARLRLGDQHLNFNGAVHGGVIFALADAVFAAASNSHEVVSVATHVSIDFLRAPRVGEELTATCRENLLARKVGNYAMEVTAGSGEAIALCQGWVYRTSQAHPEGKE
jgi:acyl-CoA thioesterase